MVWERAVGVLWFVVAEVVRGLTFESCKIHDQSCVIPGCAIAQLRARVARARNPYAL